MDERYGNEDCFATKDFREVLARKDIDAVMISTPDHWHTLISVMAIQAGKDVQCEKPTLTIDEGKILIEAVRKHKKVFQTSTEDRSVPEYHRMAELVRNGRIGKLQRIEVILPKQPNGPGDPTPQPVPPELDYDMWLGPAPYAPYTKDRVHFNFRWIWDYSGGIICDWGAHLFDTAQWANDTERSGPVEIEGTGTLLGRRALQHRQGLRRHLPLRQRRGHDLQAGQPQHQVHRHRRLGRQHRLARPGRGQFPGDPRIRDRPRRDPPLHQSRRASTTTSSNASRAARIPISRSTSATASPRSATWPTSPSSSAANSSGTRPRSSSSATTRPTRCWTARAAIRGSCRKCRPWDRGRRLSESSWKKNN